MDNKIIAFGDTEAKKHKFHYHKNPILIDDVDVNTNILSSNAFLVKNILNILLVTKIMKKSNNYL